MTFDKIDFVHHYLGFYGYPSKCHIRILEKPDKPLVVICTQLPDNPGTSVTNVTEDLAQGAYEYLKRSNPGLVEAIRKYFNGKRPEQMISDLVDRLRESKSLLVFTLESMKSALEFMTKRRERMEKIDKFVWIEHYFKDCVLSYKRNYSIVSFVGDEWRPNWRHCSIEELSSETGYPVADLDVESDLKNAPTIV